MTGQFRTFAAVSTDFEVALRYCGVSVLFCMVFCGYLISLDQLMENVPWVGWISVCLKSFTFESYNKLTSTRSISSPRAMHMRR